MKISDASPFFKTTPLFYQPLPFYGKNMNLSPPIFKKFWKLKPPIIKEGDSNYDMRLLPTTGHF